MNEAASSPHVKRFREFAENARRDAAKATSATERDALIVIAKQWDKLADETEAGIASRARASKP